TPESGPQLVTIGGKARHLSPASIDALRWLFDHDPATGHSLHDGLRAHRQESTGMAIRELLRLGDLGVNRSGWWFASSRQIWRLDIPGIVLLRISRMPLIDQLRSFPLAKLKP